MTELAEALERFNRRERNLLRPRSRGNILVIPASSELPLNTLLFSIYDFTIFCKNRKAFLR